MPGEVVKVQMAQGVTFICKSFQIYSKKFKLGTTSSNVQHIRIRRTLDHGWT